MAEVVLENISKSFGNVNAVDGISMTIPNGRICGASWADWRGQDHNASSLISGLEKLDSGSVRIAGRDVGVETPAQRDVAMVFQQYSLYPHMTVRENLSFPFAVADP